ncbi:DNA polymerase III subunit alpha [Candidatus Saccharibacteria bacterium]|nr:MAG: DNA polymerase III subunit alpha [Candidatus Saccharibacteria bacterium]
MKEGSSTLVTSDYVHLHNHTHHSLLDGLTKVPDLVARVKELGMQAVAMTDHGTLSGAIEFYKACQEEGIKPIIGIETYVAARTIHDRDPAKDKARYHLILLAMNNTGYQNLMRLSTIANLEGVYYKPRIDHDLLEQYNEGLIALSACAGGEIGENLRGGNYEEAKRIALWYQSIFGDRYYMEIQDHNEWDVQRKINEGVFRIAEETGIQCVVTSDAHYLNESSQDAHEILLCVGTGAYLSDQDRMSLKDFHLHVTDPREVIERWGKEHPEIISNTKIIADRCEVTLELGKILIPTFPTPEGYNEKTYLHELVWRGLAWRYGGVEERASKTLAEADARKVVSQDIQDRADYELGVIDSMGFNGYFLIIWDFINWGKDRGIIFGPGRGSAAGSIIAYGLKVTDLDPIKYDLLFERFLNPDRISMPDVDIDIQDTRRDEVIQYCVEKYGSERVANITTFGKMAARAAVRDVARVLQVPYAEADRLAKLIPPPVQGRHIPLSKSVQDDADLKHEYESSANAKRVIDFAVQLEGTIRSHGVHAAGVVIAPDDIVKFAPLEMAQKGVVATQYPMGPIEELGLLKMDFLGLSNLSIINNALRIIRKVYKTEINISELPLDDEETYELFQRGDTTGVFQLESAGMKRYLKDLKPTRFEDIVAMVALYRPGPMQFIDSFIRRKHGEEKITYLDKGLENSLKSTYGILVYQEQFMQISKEWSGFTGGQADTLRKAVGKKKIDLMRKMKIEFVEGAIKHSGADRAIAEKFWDQLEEFANYCFNKSHAACYGLIAYWTAYLKAHFPDAFMAAVMTSDQDDIDRLAIEIAECRNMELKVLNPDINQSFVEFAIVPNEKTIRFGMAAVKGVGTGAVEEILRAREDGLFTSITDFAKRVSTRKVNRKTWESLVKSGAFDELGDRSDILFNLDTILGYASKLQKEALAGQADLFGGLENAVAIPEITLTGAPEKHNDKERLLWERELLGLYLSAHPLDKFDAYFEEQCVPLGSLLVEHDKKAVIIGGVISSIRQIVTKSGSKMAFVKLEDKSGEGEVVVFPNLFEEIGARLAQDLVIRVSGKISSTDREGNSLGEAKVIADEIVIVSDDELNNYQSTGKKMKTPKPKTMSKSVSEKPAAKPEVTYTYKPIEDTPALKLYVHVKDPNDHERLKQLKRSLNEYPGSSEIILVLGENKSSAIRLPFLIEATDALRSNIGDLYGADCVVVK